MRASDLIRRSAVVVAVDDTIAQAAALMNEAGVGYEPIQYGGYRCSGAISSSAW